MFMFSDLSRSLFVGELCDWVMDKYLPVCSWIYINFKTANKCIQCFVQINYNSRPLYIICSADTCYCGLITTDKTIVCVLVFDRFFLNKMNSVCAELMCIKYRLSEPSTEAKSSFLVVYMVAAALSRPVCCVCCHYHMTVWAP